jgi:K+-sensing histidine kinase KdpD
MHDAHTQQKSLLGAELDHLTTRIRSLQSSTPDDILEQLFTRLAVIDPISSAGMFRLDQASSSLEWMYQSEPTVNLMNQSLNDHREGLTDMLNSGGDLVRIDSNAQGFFTGFPAGHYNGSAIGLGVSSGRSFDQTELSRLESFSLLMGLIIENARLKQAVNSKDETSSTARLIGFIAHELRTPLTGMRGNIQLALMSTRKEQYDRIPSRLEAAITGVDDMSRLVQQLLDVSRLERGAFNLTISTAQIGDTLSRAVESQSEDWRSIKLTGDLSTSLTADHESLEKVVYFLLKTVANYAEDPSKLEVSAKRSDGKVGIDLRYAGKPLSDADHVALSEPLSRNSGVTSRDENLSLELAYCRGVIYRHDGEIRLASDTPEAGQQSIQLELHDYVEA